MHEAQAVATFVLTGALALLAWTLLAGAVVALLAGIRLARSLDAMAKEGVRAAHAVADVAEGARRMTRQAEGGLRELARTVRRVAFLERILERRLARLVIGGAAAIEGIRTAIRALGVLWSARAPTRAAGEGEEETAHVG